VRGIILYGPPAAGKDTVTRALIEADPRCEMFARLKVGPGKTSTYRMTTPEHLGELRARGDIAWENLRYDSVYAIDTPELLAALRRGIPVVHLGQVEAVGAVRQATPEASWTVVSLWCPRETAQERLTTRNPHDVRERLRAWDETPDLPSPSLAINTGALTPSAAAGTILRTLDLDAPSHEKVTPPRIVVPVLTLRNADGTLDLVANSEYAARASATWLHGFIVSGTIGEGDTASPRDRERLLDIWHQHAAPGRVFSTAWHDADHASILSSGARLMAVMRGCDSDDDALKFLARLPSGSHIYSHPAYATHTFSASLAARAAESGVLPAGGKLCKLSLADIRAIRQAAGESFDLLDGRCRHVVLSMTAGASGVIAAPLSTLPDLPAEGDIEGLQGVLDTEQSRLDIDSDRSARLRRLTAECRRALS
jgi:guanylate kinase